MIEHQDDVQQRVSAALLEDPRTEDASIDVAYNQGKITLIGSVPSAYVRDAADEIAKMVKGVSFVINELKVEEARSTNPVP